LGKIGIVCVDPPSPDAMTEQRLADLFTNLRSLAPVNTDGETAKPVDVPLADDARPIWAQFVNAHRR